MGGQKEEEEDGCCYVGIRTRNHRYCRGYGLPVGQEEVSSSDDQKRKLVKKTR